MHFILNMMKISPENISCLVSKLDIDNCLMIIMSQNHFDYFNISLAKSIIQDQFCLIFVSNGSEIILSTYYASYICMQDNYQNVILNKK